MRRSAVPLAAPATAENMPQCVPGSATGTPRAFPKVRFAAGRESVVRAGSRTRPDGSTGQGGVSFLEAEPPDVQDSEPGTGYAPVDPRNAHPLAFA